MLKSTGTDGFPKRGKDSLVDLLKEGKMTRYYS